MRRLLPCALMVAMLAGCGGDDHEDLRKWMVEVSKGMRGSIPPLPAVKPYEPVPYEAAVLVDPFKPSKIDPERKMAGGGLQPDFNRPREPLEAFPLESLKYVGMMTKGKTAHALILADNVLYRVRPGNYMGQSFGMITKITEQEVTVRELVQDPTGDWVERTSTLLLAGKEGPK